MALLNRTLERAQAAPRIRAALRVPPLLPVAIVIVVGLGLVRIIQSSEATTTNYSIQELEQRRLEARTVNSELEAEIARLSALDRIQQEAERRGLVPAREQEVVSVNVPPPVVDLPGSAGAGTEREEGSSEGADNSDWLENALDLLPF
jgi:cell division protein FtsL